MGGQGGKACSLSAELRVVMPGGPRSCSAFWPPWSGSDGRARLVTLTAHPECSRRLQILATPRNHLAHALAQSGAGLAQFEPRGTPGLAKHRLVQPFKAGAWDTLDPVGAGGTVDVGGLAGE